MPEVEGSDDLLIAEELVTHAQWICGWLEDLKAGRCNAGTFKDVMRGVATDLRGLAHGRLLRYSGEAQLRLGGLWRAVDTPPATAPEGEGFSVQVWGVIDDPRLRIHEDEPFQDVVAWWPARRVWTVTHQCRADEQAVDYEVNVVAWRPLPPRGTVWR